MTSRRHFMGASVAALLRAAETNQRIRDARDAAIALLKPSEKDLQHGLELHSKSLVVESYGFAPRSAIDGDAMRQAIEAGADNTELEDLHTEMLLTRVADDSSQQQEYLEAWKASGVTCVLQNAGEEGSSPVRLLKRLAYLDTPALEHVVLAAVGGTIAILAVANLWKLWRGISLPQRDCSNRLPCVAMLIGVEVGFSSAGASALGGVALLSLTRLAPSVIVGTDLLFGLGISAVGSGLNLALDNVNGRLAAQLLIGGVAGALTGPWLATRVPMRLLRAALSLVLSISGAQLFWRGVAPLIG